MVQCKEGLRGQSRLIQGLSETNRGLQVELHVGKKRLLIGDFRRERQMGGGWIDAGVERGCPPPLTSPHRQEQRFPSEWPQTVLPEGLGES